MVKFNFALGCGNKPYWRPRETHNNGVRTWNTSNGGGVLNLLFL